MIYVGWTEFNPLLDPRDRLEITIVRSFGDDGLPRSSRSVIEGERSGTVVVAGLSTGSAEGVVAGIQTRGVGSSVRGDVTHLRLHDRGMGEELGRDDILPARGVRGRTLFAVGSTPNGAVALVSIENPLDPSDAPGRIWLSARFVGSTGHPDGESAISPRLLAQIPFGARFPTGASPTWPLGDVVGTADNSIVVAWADDRDNNGFYEIRALAYDAPTEDGIFRVLPPRFETTVNTEPSGQQAAVSLAPVQGDGHFVAVWMDDADRNGFWQIKGRILATDGTGADQFTINATPDGNQVSPSVAPLANGGFVVAWLDDEEDDGFWRIAAQMFHPDGARQGGQIEVARRGRLGAPVVGGLTGGGFVALFRRDIVGDGVFEQIAMRGFDRSGDEAFAETLVTSSGGVDLRTFPPTRRPETGVFGLSIATDLGSGTENWLTSLTPR